MATGRRDVSMASRHVPLSDVGQVDEHATPVHLADDLTAEPGEPGVLGLVACLRR